MVRSIRLAWCPNRQTSPSFVSTVFLIVSFYLSIFTLPTLHWLGPYWSMESGDYLASSIPPFRNLSVDAEETRRALVQLYPYTSNIASALPTDIWQTWRDTADENLGTELRAFKDSWIRANPGLTHRLVNDRQASELIKSLYAPIPAIFEAYRALPLPVLRADFFRYLILFAKGGVYTDIDTQALKSIEVWTRPQDGDDWHARDIGLVIGIEADPDRPDWAEWYSRRIQFCQWTIQSKAGHPVLADIITTITKEAFTLHKHGRMSDEVKAGNVVELTGPAAWTDSIMRYFNRPDYPASSDGSIALQSAPSVQVTPSNFFNLRARKLMGDVLILPITSFSPGIGHMGAQSADHKLAYVSHSFSGSWKTEKAKGT